MQSTPVAPFSALVINEHKAEAHAFVAALGFVFVLIVIVDICLWVMESAVVDVLTRAGDAKLPAARPYVFQNVVSSMWDVDAYYTELFW